MKREPSLEPAGVIDHNAAEMQQFADDRVMNWLRK
jgi:hypothetical protein